MLPVNGSVTTPFGDATPYQAAHWAIDYGTRLYEPVRAAADGVVEFAGLAVADNRLASYGMVVVIRHGERLTSLYAHLDDRAFGASVQPGDAVKQGQVIGYVGLTGNSTGPHLHFETRLDTQPFDPLLLVGSAP
jgi:murein DD-endopeptidase MepM/ murein hydrolase activator NlpD